MPTEARILVSSALEGLATDVATALADDLDDFNTEYGTTLAPGDLVRLHFTAAAASTGSGAVLVTSASTLNPLGGVVMAFDSAGFVPTEMQAWWPTPTDWMRASDIPNVRVTNTSTDDANVGFILYHAC